MAFADTVGTLVVKLIGDNKHLINSLRAAGIQAQRASIRIQRYLKQIAATSKAVGKKLTTHITLPIVGMAAASVKAFASFDEAMVKSVSIMQNTGEQTAKMRKLALELGSKGPVGPTQLAESYYFLASAGFDAQRSMRELSTVMKFSVAGAFDMATATDLLTDAQTALGDVLTRSGYTLQDLGDQIVRAAQLSNASVQQFSESITADAGVAARNFGMEIETLMAVLGAYASAGKKAAESGNLTGRALRLLTTAAREQADAFKTMNIKVINETTGDYNNFIDIIKDMEDAFKGLSRSEVSARLEQLGFAALAQKSILPLIGMSAQMKRLEQAQREAGGAMESVYQKQLESFSNQMRTLWNQIKVTAIGIGETLIPVVRKLTDRIKGLLDWWKGLSSATQKFIVYIGLTAAALGPLTRAFGGLVSQIQLAATGSLMAKTNLYLLATVAIAALVKYIYDANTNITKFNDELERSNKLSESMVSRADSAFAQTMGVADTKTGEDRVKYLQEQLDRLNQEVSGAESNIKMQQQAMTKRQGGVVGGVMDSLMSGMTAGQAGAKTREHAEGLLKENKAMLDKYVQQRNDVEKALAEARDQYAIQQKTTDDEAFLKQKELALKGAEMYDKAKQKAKEWGATFDWHVLGRIRKWPEAIGYALGYADKALSGGFKKGDDFYRVNQAVQAGSMSDYQSREMSARFLAENNPKKNEDVQVKQLDVLQKIEEAVKQQAKAAIPGYGLFNFVGGLVNGE